MIWNDGSAGSDFPALSPRGGLDRLIVRAGKNPGACLKPNSKSQGASETSTRRLDWSRAEKPETRLKKAQTLAPEECWDRDCAGPEARTGQREKNKCGQQGTLVSRA